jgi:hypothetical protein
VVFGVSRTEQHETACSNCKMDESHRFSLALSLP